jgi:flagellar basal-body rod protein FlgB
MAISIDSAFGIHAQALSLRARRAEILSSNLANTDTPGFKAKDIDFKEALRQRETSEVRPAATHPRHIGSGAGPDPTHAEALYRVPNQPAMDGNTVDPHLEKAAFAENSVRYQTSLILLNKRVRGLMTALRGE